MSGDGRIFVWGDGIRCGATLLVILINVLWFSVSGRSLAPGTVGPLLRDASMLALGVTLLCIPTRLERYRAAAKKLFMERIAITLHCVLLLVIFCNVLNILCYLTVTLDAPLIDAKLVAMDRALGFDWPALYNWVRAHALIKNILHVAYLSAFFQLLATPFALGLSGRNQYLREFLSHFMLSCFFLLNVATPFPAQSAFTHFAGVSAQDVASVSHFEMLRDGTLRVIDLQHMQGLVSMPSFHTAMAIFFAYALRWSRRLFVVSSILNCVMILSTPTEGGHYLMDLFGGVALAAITIWAMRAMTSRARFQLPAQAEMLAPGLTSKYREIRADAS